MRNFGIENSHFVTLQVDPYQGHIKINSILINKNLPGVSTAASWSGVYFESIPITIAAIPQPGFIFDHWESNVEIEVDEHSNVIKVDLHQNIILTAIFLKE
jgi:hypothetical protein